MAQQESILCQSCKKQRAVKICSKCVVGMRLLCAMCSASVHEKPAASHHKPRQVCESCFKTPASIGCHDCDAQLCRGCIVEHAQICEPSHSSEEEYSDVEDSCSESDLDFPPAAKPEPTVGSKRPFPKSEPDVEPDFKEEPQYTTTHTAVPPKAKIKKPKKPAVAKVAEVIGSKDIFDGSETQKSSTATQKVSEEVLSKIQKALALGLHPGGHEAEKTHAMKRATRLMQQYGLSQAEVDKMGKGDVEAVAGVVSVRLNGLFQRWPLWGHTLMYVANTMANTKGYFNRSRKGSTKLEDSMTVSFYGLKADAAMAANVFEVSYNLTLDKGIKEYGKKGKSKSIMDYRFGLVNGLREIADRDKKAREEALQSARNKPAPPQQPAAGKPAAPSGKTRRPVLDSDGSDEDWDDGGDDWCGGGGSSDDEMSLGHSSSDCEDDEGPSSEDPAAQQELQQLVLYDDKAKLAQEAVEEKIKIKKGKKMKQRGITDWEAYTKGKKDAESLKLGAKRLPAANSKSGATPKSTAAASAPVDQGKRVSTGGGSGKQTKATTAAAASKKGRASTGSSGKEQKDPGLVKGKRASLAGAVKEPTVTVKKEPTVKKERAVFGSAKNTCAR